MATKPKDVTELLIHGFVNEIRQLLKENTIIPVEVMKICIMFYSMEITMIYPYKQGLKMDVMYSKNITKLQKIININTDETDDNIIETACFIPNISSKINITNTKLSKHKVYDGIICCLF